MGALAGDSSDNIPGVPGIGLKTAADLINEFNTLEDLLTRSNEIKQNKRRENLIEFKDLALISKKLVTLKNDVPINLDLAELKFDINKFSERKVNYKLVTSENELKKFLEICNEKSEI